MADHQCHYHAPEDFSMVHAMVLHDAQRIAGVTCQAGHPVFDCSKADTLCGLVLSAEPVTACVGCQLGRDCPVTCEICKLGQSSGGLSGKVIRDILEALESGGGADAPAPRVRMPEAAPA